MKVVILAGDSGTRIMEESYLRPKLMIEIGGQPILRHTMKYYSFYGFHDFVICLGYKQYVIREHFADYFLYASNVTLDLSNNNMEVLQRHAKSWKMTLIDTGLRTMTGGRAKRTRDYVGDESFLLTYGDGISDMDLNALFAFRREKQRITTITMMNIGWVKGVLGAGDNGEIHSFHEKDDSGSAVISGGFMVYKPSIFDYVAGDDTVLEQEPLQDLCRDRELVGHYHGDFWQCMDTQRERKKPERPWKSGDAPWER